MRRASFPLGFLLIFAIIFSGCSQPKQTETITATETETQVTSITTSIITTTTTVATTTPRTTTAATSTYNTPPVSGPTLTTSKPPTTKITVTTTTTTTPEVTVDLSNVALIGTGEGFNIIDGQGLSDLKWGSEALDGVVDAEGKLWYVTDWNIITYDGKSWGTMWLPQGVYTLYAITIDQGGRVWIGHFKGVSVLEGAQWRTYNSDTFGLGQNASLVNDIAIDKQNGVWVATSSGVAVLNGDNWTPYDESSGLTNNSTEAVVVDHQGKVWVAHYYGVDVFDGNKWVFYGKELGKPAQIEKEQLTGARALAVDGQGTVWVGTSTKGLSYFDGSTWQTYDCREHFYGAGVNTITCDKQGHVWLGTNFGMTVFDGSTWSHYTKYSSGLLSNTINIILVTGAGPASLPTAPGLQPGSIHGKIKSGDQPLAGAKVVICWATAMFYSGSSPCSGDSYSAMTNADGDFEIDGIPPYRYSLAIQKPDGTWKIRLGWVYIVDGGTTFLGSLSV